MEDVTSDSDNTHQLKARQLYGILHIAKYLQCEGRKKEGEGEKYHGKEGEEISQFYNVFININISPLLYTHTEYRI